MAIDGAPFRFLAESKMMRKGFSVITYVIFDIKLKFLSPDFKIQDLNVNRRKGGWFSVEGFEMETSNFDPNSCLTRRSHPLYTCLTHLLDYNSRRACDFQKLVWTPV